MKIRDEFTKLFEDYSVSVTEQIDKILINAQQASMSLESIKNKLETIQELNFKGKYLAQTRIDDLQNGSLWSRLFDEGQRGIVRNQRNLQTLDGSIDFVTLASNNVNDVILKLKGFKVDAVGLQHTASLLEELPHMSVKKHVQLLQAALKRLTESKGKFEGKIERANQENEIS